MTMRELSKLTADQLAKIDHAVPVTDNGLPVAWLVPLTPGERHRADLVARGRLRPGRRGVHWSPLPATENGPTLSEILLEMRARERT
ncbi:hypothetical protein GCM10027445_31730 [Amycolatopsis endophytica]